MKLVSLFYKEFKTIVSDFFSSDPYKRQIILEWLTRNIPGSAGFVLRRQILSPRMKKVGQNFDVFPGVRLLYKRNMVVGNNVRIAYNSIIDAQGGIEIGDNTLIGHYVSIWSQNHIFSNIDQPIIQQGMDQQPVKIGNNVWVGSHSFIMPGTVIGDGVIISAGAVVGKKKIPDYSILSGNPARIIGKRN